MPAETQPSLYTVKGFIYDEHNSPLANAIVKLYDVDFRSRQELGKSVTDEKGFYSIGFKAVAANPEYKSPDLVVAVLDIRNVVLGESAIYFNVGAETLINYTIGGKPIVGENEFDSLVKLITPIIKPTNIPLGKMVEDETTKDISFLAGETGVDAQKIIFINSAFALAKTKINPAIFYGLFRMGFPLELNELLGIKAASVKTALTNAITENIISSKWLKELDGVIKTFNELAVKKVIDSESKQSKAFKILFGKALTAKEQLTFTATYYDNEETPELFWEQLKAQPDFDDKKIAAAKQLLSFYTLTDNQPELAQYLYSKQTSDPDLTEMLGYVKYNVEDWKKQITEAKVSNFPAWVAGETVKGKTENYAEQLEQLHKKLHPTAFFAARMKKDEQSAINSIGELLTFFSKNPDFDLQTNNIQKQFATANFDGVNKDSVQKELKKIHRLHKLTDDYQQVNALYGKKLFSSADIVDKYGRQQFIKEFSADMGGIEKSADIYKKAVSINNKTTALITAFKMQHDVQIYAINGDIKTKEENAEFWEGYYEMFSDGELCECEQCQSVYSAAAYFVDMLVFIRKESEAVTYDKLIKRRPDLDDILLTCKNTNTTLPYIDLVNELLEKEVMALQATSSVASLAIRNQSFQTEGLAEELLAIEEHSSKEAYQYLNSVVKDAIFSEKLPLDLPLEEIRAYTEKLGWNRYELIKSFYGNRTPGVSNDENLAAEMFGISTAEMDILTGETAIEVSLPLSPNGKCVIKPLLEKTKLTYIELLQLLETNFLNSDSRGERVITITQKQQGSSGQPILTCNLEELLLTGGSDVWLNKTVRFTRLWKKTGWNIFDLDRILCALKPEDVSINQWDFSKELITSLANVENARHILGISILQASALFNEIDTTQYQDHSKDGQPRMPSLYDNIFRNIIINDDASLSAALGISLVELSAIENTTDYSLPNLSRMYRNLLVAKALGVSITDLKALLQLTGHEIVNGIWQPQQLCAFLDDWKIFKSVGIEVNALADYFIAVSSSEYTIPINYHLLKLTKDCKNDLITLKKDATLTEVERRAQSSICVISFLDELEADDIVRDAFDAALNPADVALKTVFENYSGEEAKVMISQLAVVEMISKIDVLEKSLMQYAELILEKAPAIFNQLKFSVEETLWMKDNQIALGIDLLWSESIDLGSENFYSAFKKLFWFSILAKGGKNIWLEIPDIAIKNEVNAKSVLFERLETLYGVTLSSLEFLCGQEADLANNGWLNFAFPVDYINAENIMITLKCCKAMESLGGNDEQMMALLNLSTTTEASLSVQNLLRSKYSGKEWFDIIKPISDTLRKRKRDALSAWLIANTNGGKWNTSDDIYEDLLIDTEMDACTITSRIKQAISSVQLYIDRCLMGLELGIQMTDKFAEQWHKWRKQYRVWEANRKIFLYPENWIEPDLRDDKSSFFKELESQIKQNEITDEIAQDALMTYLEKLDTVANLEMVGLFNDEETNIVHVIGRTKNTPHQYFYRTMKERVWSAWDKVEVDIEGDHILPVVWNGKLMLIWAQFTEKQEKVTFITPSAGDPIPDPPTYFEIKLAWSEYKNGKWGSKKISKEVCKINPISKSLLPWQEHEHIVYVQDGYVTINSIPTLVPKIKKIIIKDAQEKPVVNNCMLSSDFFFGKLRVKIFQWDSWAPKKLFTVGIFTFDSCSSTPTYNNDALNVEFIKSFQAVNGDYLNLKSGEGFIVGGTEVFAENNNVTGLRVLNRTPYPAFISPIRHELVSRRNSYFFYSNSQSSFFVKSYNFINTLSPENDNIGYNFMMQRNSLPEKPRSKALNGLADDSGIREMTLDHETTNLPIRDLNIQNAVIPFNHLYGDSFTFYTFYHPIACDSIKILNERGVQALYIKDLQNLDVDNFESEYFPNRYVNPSYPKEEVDFSYTGSYSIYNWELFYQIPILMATRLTQNQKFEEARTWFHYIFNPTLPSNDDTSARRFWITKPFRHEIENDILSLEELLSSSNHAEDLEVQLKNWEINPFNTHAVARLRVSAYMRNTVLKYIDNLIQWGDQLYRRDTIESINEATQLYILASNILGKKPEIVPARAKPIEKSFFDIQDNLNSFSDDMKAEIESFITPSAGDADISMPYFCLPKNDYLLKYWDTVADRLFKIRHCMNIEGTVRQLALFEPSIDPALMVRAAVSGLDINTLLDDINNVNLPNYRFTIMLQKANELCNDVKSLGSSLLSAIEKKDGEEMALLRSIHELSMLEMIRDIKDKQKDEAKENVESLYNSRNVIQARESYYSNKELINNYEAVYFASVPIGMIFQNLQIGAQSLAALSSQAPDVTIGPFSSGATLGGGNLGQGIAIAAGEFGQKASLMNTIGTMANTLGGFHRRMDDWKFQAKSAELELKQIEKQILAAEIRLAIAEKEVENHNLQMEQSKEVDDYMRSKFTNAQLYEWMVGQVSTIYFQSYQLAYNTAKKAEKCMQYELGIESSNYVKFGYWDSLKKGLLSGEKLQYDLRRLENAYLEENKREYEIVTHISLVMLDPLALIKLRAVGQCDFEIPEVLYDMDHPGHYLRRLKSVSISLPCIAGPYTSISANLRLTDSRCRIQKNLASESLKQFGKGQSIATSNAQNDSGIFELNFRDERYLPFEGCGAISSWKLELPSEIRQFDYNTISDVIVHVKYTAREGGDDLKNEVNKDLKNQLVNIKQGLVQSGLHIVLNMRHDLPNEWHILKKSGTINLNIEKSRLPFTVQTFKELNIENIMFVAKLKDASDSFTINIPGATEPATNLLADKELNLWTGINAGFDLDTSFTLSVSDSDNLMLEELILIVKYKFKIDELIDL